jgi:hypothetical protein
MQAGKASFLGLPLAPPALGKGADEGNWELEVQPLAQPRADSERRRTLSRMQLPVNMEGFDVSRLVRRLD